MRVLVDTNIIIDVLQNRQPWCEPGKKIFLAIANKQIIGCVTAKQIADIHYFSRKQFKGQENVDAKCRTVITSLLALFELLDTLGIDCQDAIAYENNDYEDAIMISTSVRSGVDGIITRDKNHYRSAPIPVYTADEFVKKLEIQEE
mgnify:FL=1